MEDTTSILHSRVTVLPYDTSNPSTLPTSSPSSMPLLSEHVTMVPPDCIAIGPTTAGYTAVKTRYVANDHDSVRALEHLNRVWGTIIGIGVTCLWAACLTFHRTDDNNTAASTSALIFTSSIMMLCGTVPVLLQIELSVYVKLWKQVEFWVAHLALAWHCGSIGALFVLASRAHMEFVVLVFMVYCLCIHVVVLSADAHDMSPSLRFVLTIMMVLSLIFVHVVTTVRTSLNHTDSVTISTVIELTVSSLQAISTRNVYVVVCYLLSMGRRCKMEMETATRSYYWLVAAASEVCEGPAMVVWERVEGRVMAPITTQQLSLFMVGGSVRGGGVWSDVTQTIPSLNVHRIILQPTMSVTVVKKRQTRLIHVHWMSRLKLGLYMSCSVGVMFNIVCFACLFFRMSATRSFQNVLCYIGSILQTGSMMMLYATVPLRMSYLPNIVNNLDFFMLHSASITISILYADVQYRRSYEEDKNNSAFGTYFFYVLTLYVPMALYSVMDLVDQKAISLALRYRVTLTLFLVHLLLWVLTIPSVIESSLYPDDVVRVWEVSVDLGFTVTTRQALIGNSLFACLLFFLKGLLNFYGRSNDNNVVFLMLRVDVVDRTRDTEFFYLFESQGGGPQEETTEGQVHTQGGVLFDSQGVGPQGGFVDTLMNAPMNVLDA